MTAPALPSHAAMVASIIATYRAADDAQLAAGKAWYPAAGAIVRSIAEDTSQDVERCAFALAALSPRNPLRWNVQDAYTFAQAAQRGDATAPTATTFNDNRERAWQALRVAGEPWSGSAPKVRAFVRAILGDRDSIVVDTWAMRVATDGARVDVTRREYAIVAGAYAEAATVLGVDGRDVQAVTWIVAQAAGISSHRTGRHDLAFKRGTAEFVVALFGQAA